MSRREQLLSSQVDCAPCSMYASRQDPTTQAMSWKNGSSNPSEAGSRGYGVSAREKSLSSTLRGRNFLSLHSVLASLSLRHGWLTLAIEAIRLLRRCPCLTCDDWKAKSIRPAPPSCFCLMGRLRHYFPQRALCRYSSSSCRTGWRAFARAIWLVLMHLWASSRILRSSVLRMCGSASALPRMAAGSQGPRRLQWNHPRRC